MVHLRFIKVIEKALKKHEKCKKKTKKMQEKNKENALKCLTSANKSAKIRIGNFPAKNNCRYSNGNYSKR